MPEKKSVFLSAVYSFIAALISSFVFSPLFKFFYDKFLNPPRVGYGLFSGVNEELIIGGIIFSYTFFLPFFIMAIMEKKQLLAWIIGIIFPLIIFLTEGKHVAWFLVFTLSGGLLGWLIKLAIKKLKK